MGKTKVRVTVTLAPELVADIDEEAKESGNLSRSAAMEKALREWQYARAVQKLEAATAAYYDSMTEEDKREDAEWAEFSGRAAAVVWNEE